MTLLRAIEVCAFLVLAYGIVTQIALPLFFDRPLFPFFALRKQKRLEKQLVDLREMRREQDLRGDILEENRSLEERERRLAARLSKQKGRIS